jgi:hypothetical protein
VEEGTMSTIEISYYEDGALAWHDGDDEGSTIGQEGHDLRDLEKKLAKARACKSPNRDEIEYFTVELAVTKFARTLGEDAAYSPKEFWIFHTAQALKSALAVARAAKKSAMDDQPWPEWALLAQANGWKPPKGWRPG